jgi:hypothetical protein
VPARMCPALPASLDRLNTPAVSAPPPCRRRPGLSWEAASPAFRARSSWVHPNPEKEEGEDDEAPRHCARLHRVCIPTMMISACHWRGTSGRPREQGRECRTVDIAPFSFLPGVTVRAVSDLRLHDLMQSRLRRVFPRQAGDREPAGMFAPSAPQFHEVGAADQLGQHQVVRHTAVSPISTFWWTMRASPYCPAIS